MHTAYIDTGDSVVWKDTTEHWYGSYSFTLAPGAFVVTGSAVKLLHNKILVAGPGTYVVDGKAAGLLHNYVINLESGVYTIVGVDANLYDPKAASVHIAFNVWKSSVDGDNILAWQVPYEMRFLIDGTKNHITKVAGLALSVVFKGA